jgi:hypothetical protein
MPAADIPHTVSADGRGFLVLDGVAVVAGAAVASVHLRAAIAGDLFGPGWALLLATFFWIALTAAGPFLFLLRRFAQSTPYRPKVGDWLWAGLGLPWLLTALIQAAPGRGGQGRAETTFEQAPAALLMGGVGAACLLALAVVWTRWVMVPPERAAETFAPPWTNRVGLVLAIAWPVQCGAGMVVNG